MFLVTIKPDEEIHFKGFLIEAKIDLDNEEAIGTWKTDNKHTKTIDCFEITDVNILLELLNKFKLSQKWHNK